MRVLFDTNIVLDILLKRIPWQEEADTIFANVREEKLIGAVTTLCIANVFYVGRRLAGMAKARQSISDCMAAFEVLPVDRQTLENALQLPSSDFEDNIQTAAAVQAGLDCILTRDAAGYSASPIAVYSPADLLKKLNA